MENTSTAALIQQQNYRIAVISMFLTMLNLLLFWFLTIGQKLSPGSAVIYLAILDGSSMMSAALGIDVFDDYDTLKPVNRLGQIFFWAGIALAYAGAFALFQHRLH